MPNDQPSSPKTTEEPEKVANNDPHKVEKLANIGKDGDAVEEAEDE